MEDGTGRLLIRRSKTDQAGEGHVAYLSRDTVRFVKAWLKAARIKEGTVTYDKKGRGRIGGRLSPEAVAWAFKAVARWKTTVMPMRYGEEVQAGRGGMARAAKAQGRAR